MKFSLQTQELAKLSTDMLAISAFEEQLTELPLFRDLDQALEGRLAEIVQNQQFEAKSDQKLVVHTLGFLPARQVLIVGLGKREAFDVTDTRRYAATASRAAVAASCRSLTLSLPPLDPSAGETTAQLAVEGAVLGSYSFDKYKSKDKKSKAKLESIQIWLPESPADKPHLSLRKGEIRAAGVALARDLVNEPAASLTPKKFAELAQTLANKAGLECKVLGPKECDKQKLRLLLAVSQGSVEEPRFIHLKYTPKGRAKPRQRLVLIGKGVTFDSGGLSLKPPASMLEMKTDMAGAAAVLGVMQALPGLGIKAEVHGLIAATENMPSGSAVRVGDVITGLGGKSVEIVNTDAEGRLTLADALAYALKLSPDEIIDVATLTGACMVALGPHMAGLMGNDLAMIERFLAASRMAGEEVWHLPLPTRLGEQLKSSVADLKNAGDRWGGALTAGLFLKEFVGDVPWLHLDIAGPARADKDWGHICKGGTGFGVAALLEYLVSHPECH